MIIERVCRFPGIPAGWKPDQDCQDPPKVTKRRNTDHKIDGILINWQYVLPPIKVFYKDNSNNGNDSCDKGIGSSRQTAVAVVDKGR
jgi:hypothetical protein